VLITDIMMPSCNYTRARKFEERL